MGWKRNASVALGLVLMSGCGLTTDLGDGTISCSNRRDDWWRVHVSAPTTVAISVDTVSRGTAFDPSIDIYDVDVWSNNPNNIVRGSFVGAADDDFACTFPPTNYECPSETVNASQDFLVVVENLGSCVGSVGSYSLQAIGADAITYLGQEPL